MYILFFAYNFEEFNNNINFIITYLIDLTCSTQFILLIFDCNCCKLFYYITQYYLACNDNCTGILLDTIAMLSEDLAVGTSHIADGYIPPPWEELTYIDTNATLYFEELELRTRLQQRMKTVPWHEYKKFKEDVEVMLRNVCYFNTKMLNIII